MSLYKTFTKIDFYAQLILALAMLFDLATSQNNIFILAILFGSIQVISIICHSFFSSIPFNILRKVHLIGTSVILLILLLMYLTKGAFLGKDGFTILFFISGISFILTTLYFIETFLTMQRKQPNENVFDEEDKFDFENKQGEQLK